MQTQPPKKISERPELLVTLKTMRKHLRSLRKHFNLFETEPQRRYQKLHSINVTIATILQELPLLEAQNTHKNTHATTRLERRARELIADLERRLRGYGLVREENGIVLGEGRGWDGLGRSKLAVEDGVDVVREVKRDEIRRLMGVAEDRKEDEQRKGRLRRSKRIAKSKMNVTEEHEIEVTDEDEDWSDNHEREPERDYIPLFDAGIYTGNRWFVDEDMEMSDDDDNDYFPSVKVRREETRKDRQIDALNKNMDDDNEGDDRIIASQNLGRVAESSETEKDKSEFMKALMHMAEVDDVKQDVESRRWKHFVESLVTGSRKSQIEIMDLEESDEDDHDYIPPANGNGEMQDNRTGIVDLTMDTDQSEDDDCTITLVTNGTRNPDQTRTEHGAPVENIIHKYDYDYRPAIDRKRRIEESWIELGMVLKDELLWCDPRDYFDENLLP